MSRHLERDLDSLKKNLLTAGALVENAVRNAISALHKRDRNLARSVVTHDRDINQIELQIDEECLKMLALHQPVASDLRFITSVLKINNDLERMGDLAANIAGRISSFADIEEQIIPVELESMTDQVADMVHQVLDAFVNRDAEQARHVCAIDDKVDEIHHGIVREVVKHLNSNSQMVDPMLALFSISKHLERIADHATNIAEDVVYMIEGEIIRHGGIN